MKNLFLLLSLCVMFVACGKMEGHLNVKESLTLNTKKGLFKKRFEPMTLNPGEYGAQLKIDKKKELVYLKVEVKGRNGNFPFKLPPNADLFISDGEVNIPSSESGQPVDVHAKFKTDIDVWEYDDTWRCVLRYDEVEICEVTTPAHKHCTSVDGTITGCEQHREEISCRTEMVPEYGEQDVRVRATKTTRFTTINLLEQGSVSAQFLNTEVDTQREAIYSGPCI